MLVAFSTNDGKHLIEDHFGDAKIYPIYEITADGYKFIKTVENTTEAEGEHEEHHGDPKKAQGIDSLMKKNGVQVLAGKAFGPNIVRMNPQFVVVLVNNPTVDEALEVLVKNFDLIQERWNQGSERKHLNLKVLNA